jgi:hypothetical protein
MSSEQRSVNVVGIAAKCTPLLLAALCCIGCSDSPEVPRGNYGQIHSTLPDVPGSNEPFKFPFDDNTDHSACKFKYSEETGELVPQ